MCGAKGAVGGAEPAIDGAVPVVGGTVPPVPAVNGAVPAIGGAVPAVGGTMPAVNGAAPAPAIGGAVPAVNSAAPATDGAVAAHGPIQIHIPHWKEEWCMEELIHFRTTARWADLVGWVKGSLATSARRALAVHTTDDCQYRKAPGPSGSNLKSCGLETLIPDPADGTRAHVELHLPNAFAYGDGLRIKHVSQQVGRGCVQSAACVELLCWWCQRLQG